MPSFLLPLVLFLFRIVQRVLFIFASFALNIKTALVASFVFIVSIGAAPFIIQLLISLGIGYFSYSLGGFALTVLYDNLIDSMDGLPTDMIMFIYVARIDEAVSILFGALSARLALAGFSGGLSRVTTVFAD